MGGTSQDITAPRTPSRRWPCCRPMATTANEATSLVDVVPTIIADVATPHRLASRRRPGWSGDDGARPRRRATCGRRAAGRPPRHPAPGPPGRPSRRARSRRSTTEGTSSWPPRRGRGPRRLRHRHGHPRRTATDRHRRASPSARPPPSSPGSPSASGRAERLAAGPRRGDGGLGGQVGVPRDDEPRDPHADERRHRPDRAAAAHRARRPPAPARRRHRRAPAARCSRSSTTSSTSPRSRPGELELEDGRLRPARRRRAERDACSPSAPRAKGLELVVACHADVPRWLRGDPVRFGQVITNLAPTRSSSPTSGEVVVRALASSSRRRDARRAARRGQRHRRRHRRRRSQRPALRGLHPGRHLHHPPATAAPASAWRSARQLVDADGRRDRRRQRAGRRQHVLVHRPFDRGRRAPAPGRRAAARRAARPARPGRRRQRDQPLHPRGAARRLADRAPPSRVGRRGPRPRSTTPRRRRRPFDVVLLDHIMPGVNGEQFARMVRGDGRLRATPGSSCSPRRWTSTPDVAADAGIDAVARPSRCCPRSLLDTLANVAGARARRSRRRRRHGRRDRADRRSRPARAAGSSSSRTTRSTSWSPSACSRASGTPWTSPRTGSPATTRSSRADGHYDAVLMDCQMPADGRLRRDPHDPVVRGRPVPHARSSR